MAWDSATWYLGWLGEMRALPTPDPDLSNIEERFGGIHQGLNGARIMDTLGTRLKYEMNLKYLTNDELAFVRALYTQMIPGPHYLINPMHKNLLSLQASANYYTGLNDLGMSFRAELNREYANDFPTGLAVSGSRCVKATTQSIVGGGYVRMDGQTKFTPWQAGETMTFSIYMKADVAYTVNMIGDTVDKYGVTGTVQGPSAKNVTTSWARYSFTMTQSGTIAGLRPTLLFPTGTNVNVYLAAPQLEIGPTATSFKFGGGSSKVMIDQITSSSPRFPLNVVDLSILEA